MKNSAMVFDLLSKLALKNVHAILMVSHNPSPAQDCDHMLRMSDGEFCGESVHE